MADERESESTWAGPIRPQDIEPGSRPDEEPPPRDAAPATQERGPGRESPPGRGGENIPANIVAQTRVGEEHYK